METIAESEILVLPPSNANEKNVDVPNQPSPSNKPTDIHIIKQTSLGPKMSTNVFEEGPKVVGDITITVDGFGMITTDKSTEVVKRYTFANKNKMQVQVISLGATVTSIKLPDKNGAIEDVVLGFDSIEGKMFFFRLASALIQFSFFRAEYFQHANPNIGCTLGRDAFETLQDEHYCGLGLYNWIPSIDDSRVRC